MEEPVRVKKGAKMPKGKGRCGSCTRTRGCRKLLDGKMQDCVECTALRVMTGMVKKCSFWTDDPDWEEKLKGTSDYYDYERKCKAIARARAERREAYLKGGGK